MPHVLFHVFLPYALIPRDWTIRLADISEPEWGDPHNEPKTLQSPRKNVLPSLGTPFYAWKAWSTGSLRDHMSGFIVKLILPPKLFSNHGLGHGDYKIGFRVLVLHTKGSGFKVMIWVVQRFWSLFMFSAYTVFMPPA